MMFNPYVLLGAVGFWLVSVTGSYLWGAHNADNSAMVVALQKDVLQRDQLIERMREVEKAYSATLLSYNTQLQRSEQSLDVLRKAMEDYESELAKKPPPAECLFTPSDIDGLSGK